MVDRVSHRRSIGSDRRRATPGPLHRPATDATLRPEPRGRRRGRGGGRGRRPGTRRARRRPAWRRSAPSTARTRGAPAVRRRCGRGRGRGAARGWPVATDPAQAFTARARARVSPTVVRSARGQGVGVGEEVGQPERADPRHRSSVPLDEASGQRGRARDRDLLAEDGAHAHLERVDRAGNAHAAAGANQRPQGPVAGEGGVDDGRVGVEVEEPPHAGEEVHESVERGEVHADAQRGTLGLVPHLDHARRVAELDHAAVHARRRGRSSRLPGWRAARGTRASRARRAAAR